MRRPLETLALDEVAEVFGRGQLSTVHPSQPPALYEYDAAAFRTLWVRWSRSHREPDHAIPHRALWQVLVAGPCADAPIRSISQDGPAPWARPTTISSNPWRSPVRSSNWDTPAAKPGSSSASRCARPGSGVVTPPEHAGIIGDSQGRGMTSTQAPWSKSPTSPTSPSWGHIGPR